MKEQNSIKIGILAGVGGMLEFYCFILYILFYVQIEQTFFEGVQSAFLKNLLTIAVFSVAYIVRPIGSVILGIMGDNYGRKKTFTFTILLMSATLIVMGLTPGYAKIGVAAPIIFIVFRILQGIALGGELPTAIVFTYESVKKKGLALGILFTFVMAGFVFGALMSIFFKTFFGAYAWRVAFLSGAFIGVLGYYIRQKLHETPMFEAISQKEKFPLRVLLTKYAYNQVATILVTIIIGFAGVVVSLYLAKYFKVTLGLKGEFYTWVLPIGLTINLVFIYFSGIAVDKINHKKMYQYAAYALLVLAIPAFLLMNLRTPFGVSAGFIILAFPTMVCVGSFMIILCESFPTNVRLSGVGVAYNLAFAIVGGFAPVSIELLIPVLGKVYGIATVSIVCAILTIIGTHMLKKAEVITH